MKNTNKIIPIVLTYNEEFNIAKCLKSLQVFEKIIVVDSGSTDSTLSIISKFGNVQVFSNPFESFAQQWNFAKKLPNVEAEWVLALDADYELTEQLIYELVYLDLNSIYAAYRISFIYSINGCHLSKSLYPPIIALYKKSYTQYVDDGHCMRAIVDGKVGTLNSKIIHDDRKPLSRWLNSQLKYAEIESGLLLSKKNSELKIQDRLRKLIVITPWLVPLYYFIFGLGFVDGKAGIFYALQRSVAESILMLKIIEKRYFLSCAA